MTPLDPRIRSKLRASLIVGPRGAPDERTRRIRWAILSCDRAARLAQAQTDARAALKSLPDGDAA